jgi:20S proteasome subunit alpha 6
MSTNRGGGQTGGNARGPARQQGFNQNRRAGNASFNNAGGFHQGGSFKNRNQGHGNQNRQRHDGGSQSQQKENATPAVVPPTGKKEENKRTLTDFKIIGLEIPELNWSWGALPTPAVEAVKVELKDEPLETAADVSVKDEVVDNKAALKVPSATDKQESLTEAASQATEVAEGAESQKAPASNWASRYPVDANGANPPPSRMRIYFDTPVTADDSKPIPHNASHGYGDGPPDSRKGKRKKLDDDDGDSLDDRRAPPPPPQMTVPTTDDRSSVAASVAPSTAETASEGDWLMAAIVEGDEEAQTAAALQPDAEGDDGDSANGDHEQDVEHDGGGEEDLDADAEGEVEHLIGDDGEQPFCLKLAVKVWKGSPRTQWEPAFLAPC